MIGIALLSARIRQIRQKPIVFVFHDVTDQRWFEDCISEILSARQILPLEEVATYRENGSCALTFDDGRRSVVEVVHPVLRKRGLPYTVFICTDLLMGGPVPWFVRIDHLTDAVDIGHLCAEWSLPNAQVKTKSELTVALKEIPLERILSGLERLEETNQMAPLQPERLFIRPADITRLAAEGVTFGSHTRRHPILSALSTTDQRHEIETSRDEVEELVGVRPSQFAYPNGGRFDFDQGTMSIVRASGFSHAYTTVQRHLSVNDEPFALPRIGLGGNDSRARRAMKQLAPWLSLSHGRERKIRSRVNAEDNDHRMSGTQHIMESG